MAPEQTIKPLEPIPNGKKSVCFALSRPENSARFASMCVEDAIRIRSLMQGVSAVLFKADIELDVRTRDISKTFRRFQDWITVMGMDEDESNLENAHITKAENINMRINHPLNILSSNNTLLNGCRVWLKALKTAMEGLVRKLGDLESGVPFAALEEAMYRQLEYAVEAIDKLDTLPSVEEIKLSRQAEIEHEEEDEYVDCEAYAGATGLAAGGFADIVWAEDDPHTLEDEVVVLEEEDDCEHVILDQTVLLSREDAEHVILDQTVLLSREDAHFGIMDQTVLLSREDALFDVMDQTVLLSREDFEDEWESV
ncbi:uncharacterized protein DSM5745_03954 [Aspergillus mulundensis]|uniref:Uncharacterized protein n=1 Tax=Aspergillus mulundensis TaxID=1810919 RepID=A0A3D8SCY0_9EURO|nr:hypothetical protein DSM5745_03954 [Aspergillus mulundensis]RDW83628.1 hypothetical protein DSM5745_03954 [Aspergillus mulundensis]